VFQFYYTNVSERPKQINYGQSHIVPSTIYTSYKNKTHQVQYYPIGLISIQTQIEYIIIKILCM